MFNVDDIINENNKEHNEKWPFVPDHQYRILIIAGSGSGKTNALLNLIKEQGDIDKMYLYVKDLSELKYEFLIKKREDAGINQWSKCIDWVLKHYGWRLWQYWRLQPKQKKKNLNCFWWHNCRHYDKQKIKP